jgi:uncharacterized protein
VPNAVVDVVIDTVAVVRSLINPKSIWGELVFRRRDRYRLIVSQAIVAELYDVMERPEVARKFRFVATEGPDTIREFIVEAIMVDPMALPWSGRDPNDDVFIATAMAAGAPYVVSEDRDLLDIGNYEGITMVDAATFLALLAENQSGR